MSRSRRIASWIVVGLVSALMLFSASGKFTAGPDHEIARNFVRWGLEGLLVPIGILELTVTLLFLVPSTSSIGVLLFSAYLGGAIVTHLEHGEAALIPLVGAILLVAWIGYYLRYPEMLVSLRKQTRASKGIV